MLDQRTQIFEDHRRLLEGLAYRMLGTLADARDVVQDTYLKWSQSDPHEIRDACAWLVTVCSRLALNTLQSARARRETYVGTWLPEPLLDDPTRDPAAQAQIDDTVSLALMLALENLSPPERAAFLLHDVFGCDFDEIAATLGKTSAACRKLASRARAAVRGAKPQFTTSTAEHESLVRAFFDAARGGNVDQLRRVLASDVEFYADGGGKAEAVAEILHGAEVVGEFAARIWKRHAASQANTRLVPQWFNGMPGMLVYENGQLTTAFSFSIDAGAIRHVYAHRHPEKLAAFQAP